MSQVTKKALSRSLKNMLMQKPFSKITVADIATDCGVSRMAFYYYFADIYDLVEWTCEEDARTAIAMNKTQETWQQGFLNLFNAVAENRPFVMNVYHSVSREHIERYLYTTTYKLISDVVEEKAKEIQVPEDDKNFIIDFYKYIFVGIMLNWVQGGMREDPQSIVNRLCIMIHGDIERSLERFQADESQL